jgi:hypothetical protein
MRCPVCDLDAPVQLRSPNEVAVGTVGAAVERRPVVRCPDDHDATPAHLVGAAMEAVDASVERARSRLLRSDVCRACGSDLRMPVRRTARTVTVEDPRMPIVTLHLDLPMTRCGECGVDQVPSRSHEDLTVVVPALFAPPEPRAGDARVEGGRR